MSTTRGWIAAITALLLVLSTSFVPAAAQATGTVTALALDGWFDERTQTVLRPPDATFKLDGDPGGFSVEVTPPPGDEAGPWSLEFGAPPGKPLIPGKYTQSRGGSSMAVSKGAVKMRMSRPGAGSPSTNTLSTTRAPSLRLR